MTSPAPCKCYLCRLRRAAERLRRLAAHLEAGGQDEQDLLVLESQVSALTYYINLEQMTAATRRPESPDETEQLVADCIATFRRAS